MFALNRQEKKEGMIGMLLAGTNIVCDRYAYSGVCYSAAKGLDFNWCLEADKGMVKPDLVFYIKTSLETIQSRAGFGEERFERTEFQGKVKEQYS